MKLNLRNRITIENIPDVYIIIAVIIYVIFPVILFGLSELDNDLKDFVFISIINLLIIVIPIFIFKRIVQLKPRIELILIILCVILFSILPQIFYKIYKENPDSYTFENKFVKYIKKENQKEITNKNYFLLQNQHYYDSLLSLSNSFEKLPRDRDTLIKLDKKTIVLCPSEKVIEGGAGFVDCKIRIYDITKGVELFSFPKKGESLNSSYKLHKQNLQLQDLILLRLFLSQHLLDCCQKLYWV